MPKKLNFAFLLVAVWTTAAPGQSTLTTSGGTTYTVPVFTGSTAVGNSAITSDSSGNVGLGTSSPAVLLSLQWGDQANARLRISNTGIEGRSFDLVSGINNISQTGFSIYDATAAATRLVIDQNGHVGIGTTSPGERLEVNGGVKLSSGSGGNITFPDGTSQNTAYTSGSVGTITTGTWNGTPLTSAYIPGDVMYTDTTQAISGTKNFTSNVGVGNYYPPQPLSVNGNIFSGYAVGSYMIPDYGSPNGYQQGFGINAYFNGSNWILGTDGANNAGGLIIGSHGDGAMRIFTFPSTGGSLQTISNSGLSSYQRMLISSSGYVGIGTGSPTVPLEVNGSVKLTSGSGASMTYADGTVQSTAWTGTLTGGDYAESVDVTGDRNQYEPGDVLVVDPDHPGHFLKATVPYSLAVTGVYSTKPGVVGRRQKIAKALSTTEVPMAMVGIVPTKVTAENGPIKPGDVLVTSSTPGCAMKGTDRSMLAGAVIGKALESLSSGIGMIEAVISLQ